MQLAEVGEFGFIERLARRISTAPGVRLGIGDDCAITDPPVNRSTLTTTDLLIEGVHFDLSFTDPGSLGNKSLAVNLSDIAAMGGVPRHVLLGLAIPPATTIEFLDAFSEAFLALADSHGVNLIGGDTCASHSGLMVSVTLMGEQEPDCILTRRGARPGDLVVISGTVGDSAAGLLLLQEGSSGRGHDSRAARFCIDRHLLPTPRVALGQLLAQSRLPTAMIDVSDGVIADLGHILASSGVGADLDLTRLPLSAAYRKVAASFPGNFWECAAAGGEDYELLFTMPPSRSAELPALQAQSGIPLTVVGTITSAPGLQLAEAGGLPVTLALHGYNHFT